MDYKRVLILHFTNGMSGREIAETTGDKKTTVNEFLKRFRECKELSYPLPEEVSNEFIAGCLYKKAGNPVNSDLYRDFDPEEVHRALAKKGETLKHLWKKYNAVGTVNGRKPLSYRQFCRRYTAWLDSTKVTFHIQRIPGVNLELELCFCAELPGSFRVILQESQSPAGQSQIRCDGRFGLKGRAVPHDQDFAVDTRFPECKAFLNLRNREAADFRILGIDFCGRNRSEPVEIVFQDRNQLNARLQFRKDLFRILPQDSEVNLEIRIIQKLIHHLFFLFLFHTAPDTWKVPNAALWYYIVLFDFMQEEFISIQKFFCSNRFLFSLPSQSAE